MLPRALGSLKKDKTSGNFFLVYLASPLTTGVPLRSSESLGQDKDSTSSDETGTHVATCAHSIFLKWKEASENKPK